MGVRFSSDVDGQITGIRFYKGTNNTGTHIGNLWTKDGVKLASATFTNETASGWQQVTFSSPVQITADTVYVASYYAPNGDYPADGGYFANGGTDNAPLHALGHGIDGLFIYGSDAFPTNSFNSTNYYVDVVFQPTSTPINPITPPSAPGNPILVVTSTSSNFSQYYTQILHAEGLNSFVTGDISTITPQILSNYQVVVLGQMSLTASQVTMLTDWVNNGGNLIAMRPDSKLANLLGITSRGTTLSDAYLLTNTTSGPGEGITNQTIQYHGVADLYALNGATAIATFYSDATTATSNPAVVERAVGKGHAAAFTYDLATSVIYTRQGNPAYAGQARDGNSPPTRADNLFFPNYVDFTKIQIPQADEQQRLLANMITELNLQNAPLPRFWYFPNKVKAAILYAQDNHNNVGTATSDAFNTLLSNSPNSCTVSAWQCYRGTAYVYVGIPLTNAQATTYVSEGFELGVHVNNICTDFTSYPDAEPFYLAQINNFKATYPSVPAQTTNRFHCIVWSDWLTQARAELSNGMHLSLDYYYWPGTWTLNRPGLFTGSGLPMKYADVDGTAIDVYQVVTDFPNDNSNLAYPNAIDTILANATGPNGYYGVFATHDDYTGGATYINNVISEAKKYNVPIVSSLQVLNWTEGRDNSGFSNIAWNGNNLSFTVSADANAVGLYGMLPVNSTLGTLQNITEGGSNVGFTTQTIKGIDYAFFPTSTGSYIATYSGNTSGSSETSGGPGSSGSSQSNSATTAAPTTPQQTTKQLQITDQQVTSTSTTTQSTTPQSYTLIVKILQNGHPLTGATVTLHSSQREAKTDTQGVARFENVAPGMHTVLVAYRGYTGSEIVDLNQPNSNVTISITIKTL